MIYTVDLKLAFNKAGKAQAESLRDALAPYFLKAVNINEGLDNQETGFIEVRECYHDDPTRTIQDKILARWEVGRGRII